jgi:ectoine hydroxylase-related dioxygenase (phytanoyl-CoA dioxygenase family)
MIKELETKGFAVIKNVVDNQIIAVLLEDLSKLEENKRNKGVYGVRNLLNLSTKAQEFANSRIVRAITGKYLGKDAKIVRAIYFDKTPNANWKVPWHQDLTIAVCEKIENKGFTAWTKKAGIHHVQPPTEVLEKMLTLRFHLDDADEANGALKVFANSHKLGRLGATKIQVVKSNNTATLCEVKKGDCLLMKPLLVHSSSAGLSPKHRRVVHFEFSADNLPNGLQFYGT